MAKKNDEPPIESEITETPKAAHPIMPAENDPAMQRPEKIVTYVDGKPVETSTRPPDLDDYKGKYKHPGIKEPFGLKVDKDNPHGRTHWLKNINYTWAGTEEEFKQQFDKE